MIVTEEQVGDALAYLSDDPHPFALAKKDVADAENKCRQTFARVFIDRVGSVEARKSAAEIAPEYVAAKAEEGEAILALERHRARIRAAEMLLEIWRSENANARAAERIR